MSYSTCSASRVVMALAVLATTGTAFGSSLHPVGRPTPAYQPNSLDRLLERSDQTASASETAEEGRARRTLLQDMLAYSPMCFVANPTQAQMDHILQTYNALPVGGVMQNGGLVNRFFIDGVAWTGNGGQGGSAQAARTILKFSFPNDGTAWDGGSNNLNSRFTAQFGAANVDRGRELIRQAFAAWRRNSGLTYNEVADTNSGFSQSPLALGNGDIRIGSRPLGGGGVLAYNYFPTGGGDMVVNSNELVAGSMFSAANNYRFLRNVIAHEHGHGLGFIHSVPCNSTKLMEPFASANFEMTQIDEIRGSQRNHGDRFAGNGLFSTAQDFGSLTTPVVKSIIERNLSTNSSGGPNGTFNDWFKFTIGSAQNVVITVTPTGGTYTQGQQTGNCDGSLASVAAIQAGNLNLELLDSTGATILQNANTAAAGSPEVVTANALAAGTYSVRVVDVGPNISPNQFLQLYDLTIRVGTSKAPPQAVAGVNKRVAAGQACFFMGDTNSRVTEQGATLNTASYDWDLDGDGIFETNDSNQPVFTYPANGIFNARLRVTDSNGMAATDTITVTVVGAVSAITSVVPNTGQVGGTTPVTITGVNLAGTTSAAQVAVSGTGVTVAGTPVVSGGGTTINGLSFVISAGAPVGVRSVTINNADGTGQNAVAPNSFTVTNTPPANDTCAAPISWGSVSGPRPFSNVNATTGTPQSFSGTGCPAAGPINNDVWYTWTAPGTGNLSINTDSATAGTPATFSSRVAVYNTAACPPGTPLGCDDFGASFSIFAIGGRTYLFQVGTILAGITGTANVILNFTEVVGSCCDSSGNCSITPSNACVGGSTWSGAGTTCELNPCEIPPGTCCAIDGSCTIAADAPSCSGAFAPGGSCTPNPCEQPTGSCCAPDGGCVVNQQADCTAGIWSLGAGCEPNNCPQLNGACCTGTACAVGTQAACSGIYQGNGSACGPTGNPTTCCPANFNLNSGITVQDIFDFLAAYFAAAPGADFNQVGGITVQDIFDFLSAYFAGCPG